MKIENRDGSDTFIFPVNPKTYDDSGSTNGTITEIQYSQNNIIVAGGGVKPKSIIISGSLHGDNKNLDYQKLSKHFLFEDYKLKKLYWEDDKFYLGQGLDCKKIHNAGRTNFVDYVSSFRALYPVLFGEALKTSGINEGNVDTFIEEITGTATGAEITIQDNAGNKISIPSDAVSAGSFKLEAVKMLDSGSGIYVSEYNYVEINGAVVTAVRTKTGLGYLKIKSGEASSAITITGLTNPVIKFRDAYSA